MLYAMAMILMRRACAIPLLLAAFAVPLVAPLRAEKPAKLPRDAPYCALPGARQLFVAPMGEPFRAPSGAPYPSAAWVAEADRDKDGAIDRSEFLDDARRFFRTIDRDHDGRLTPEEVIAYEHDVAPEIALYSARPGLQLGDSADAGRGRSGSVLTDLLGSNGDESNYGGPMGAGRYAWLNIPEPVASADADVDRLVSEAEFLASAGRRFDVLTQGRGMLRLADLAKTPAQMSLEGPCRPRPKPRKGRDGRRDEERDRLTDQEGK